MPSRSSETFYQVGWYSYVETCVNARLTTMGDVADPLNPGQKINKAECTVTVTAPDSVSSLVTMAPPR